MTLAFQGPRTLVAVLGAAALATSLTGCGAFDLSLLVSNSGGGSSSQAPAPSPPQDPRPAEPAPAPAETAGPALCKDGSAKRDVLLTGEKASGVWLGDIVEPHGAQYRLRAILSDDGCQVEGTFEYQGLNCSGTWSCGDGTSTGSATSLRPE
ncbi:hypothetical protein ACXR2T_01360 [Leucobacter sp. HY1910]